MKSFHFKDNILIIMIMHKSKLEKIFHHDIQNYYIRLGRLAIVFGKPSSQNYSFIYSEEKLNGI